MVSAILARAHRIGYLMLGRCGWLSDFEQVGQFWTDYPQPPLIIIAHGDGTRPWLSGSEALRCEAEGGLMRKGAGEEEADAAGVAHDDGADLEQATAQDPDLSAGELGTGQTDGAQSFHQHVGERGEQQAELIGPPQMATGAIGEQAELTFLDPILHLAAGAVHRFVERLRFVAQIGHHEAGIGALGVVLGFGDQPAMTRPAAGAVVKFAEDPLSLLGPGEGAGRLFAPPLGLRQQAAVLGHADDVMDVMALAPRQQQRTAEAGVTAEDDAHSRPRLAQPSDQQLEDRRRMQRRILLCRPQVGNQQLLAAEHIERQEADNCRSNR